MIAPGDGLQIKKKSKKKSKQRADMKERKESESHVQVRRTSGHSNEPAIQVICLVCMSCTLYDDRTWTMRVSNSSSILHRTHRQDCPHVEAHHADIPRAPVADLARIT